MTTWRSLVAVLLLWSAQAAAEVKTFVREYTYKAGEADSKLTARTNALEQVKKLLLEEIGVYLESKFENVATETTVGDKSTFKELTRSQIMSITAGVTETKILSEKWDGENYYLKAEIRIDVDDVREKVKAIAKDRDRVMELEEMRRQANARLSELDSLKKELAKAKSDAEKAALKKTYGESSTRLTSLDQAEKGYNAYFRQKYDEALAHFTEAAKLDDGNYVVFFNLGTVRYALGDFAGALPDFATALQINPKYSPAFVNRGVAKIALKDYAGAAQDLSEAAKLNASDYFVHYNLACVYALQGKQKDALDHLEAAFKAGFSDFNHLSRDTDLDNIRKSNEFKTLINRYKK